MNRRLKEVLRVLRTGAEDDPPHITLVDAFLWQTNGMDVILLESDLDFAVPANFASHQSGPPTLALLDELHAFLAQRNEREPLTGLLDPVKHAGYDNRGFACIDVRAYRVHSGRCCGKPDCTSTQPMSLSERLATLRLSETPVTLHVPYDGVTEELLTALVQIEHDLVSKLSVEPQPVSQSAV